MGKLELNPPLLIITMGYPGAGKTFFARQFAEKFDLPRISEERLRFELFENPQFNTDEDEIIGRILEYCLEQFMKAKETVICDGDFSSYRRRAEFIKLAQKNGYQTLTVWLQTDTATSAGRAMRRDRREVDSRYSFNIDQQTFNRLAGQLERPLEKEASIVISGKHAHKSQAVTILRKITDVYANIAMQKSLNNIKLQKKIVSNKAGLQSTNLIQ